MGCSSSTPAAHPVSNKSIVPEPSAAKRSSLSTTTGGKVIAVQPASPSPAALQSVRRKSDASDHTRSPNAMLQSRRGLASMVLLPDNVVNQLKATNSINWADPKIFSGRLQESFDYYCKLSQGSSSDQENDGLMDKSVIPQLAADCLHSTMQGLTAQVQLKHKGWSATKVQKEVDDMLPKYLPGKTSDERQAIAEYYTRHELRVHDGVVTKACFFLHFPRLHRNLFTSETLTIEHEALVEKLNKMHADKQIGGDKDGKRLTARGSKGGASFRSVKDASASKRHSKAHKSGGMFDDALDGKDTIAEE